MTSKQDKETIQCPMRVVNIFPWGDVLVPDIEKLKEVIKGRESDE